MQPGKTKIKRLPVQLGNNAPCREGETREKRIDAGETQKRIQHKYIQ